MNIKIIKLVSTEELVAEVKDGDTDIEIVLENPARIAIIPQDDGQAGLALVPWVPYADIKNVPIKKSHIICMVDPVSEIVNQYNERFGSGIVIPDFTASLKPSAQA